MNFCIGYIFALWIDYTFSFPTHRLWQLRCNTWYIISACLGGRECWRDDRRYWCWAEGYACQCRGGDRNGQSSHQSKRCSHNTSKCQYIIVSFSCWCLSNHNINGWYQWLLSRLGLVSIFKCSGHYPVYWEDINQTLLFCMKNHYG